jgi:hypothetical protein
VQPRTLDLLDEEVLPLVGHGWTTDLRPVNATDVRHTLIEQIRVLSALDQIRVERQAWQAGPAALSLMPRVLRLAPWLDEPDGSS